MTLNCAAYLFGGVALESESKTQTETTNGGSGKLGLPFLQSFIGVGIEAERKRKKSEENRSARRYTVGGLHMSVLDELSKRNMIFRAPKNDVSSLIRAEEAYVEIAATLRPTDYYMLLGTLKTVVPLVAQVLRDYGESLLPPSMLQQIAGIKTEDRASTESHALLPSSGAKLSAAGKPRPANTRRPPAEEDIAGRISGRIERYEASLLSLLDRFEADYLTSKQLEMVMWSEGEHQAPIGIVDLDATDYDPAAIVAKLAGGSYHVLGKVIGRAANGESLNMMQRTRIWSILDIVSKVIAASQGEESAAQFRDRLGSARVWVDGFLPLQIPGPAMRVAAMSICM